MRLLFITTTTNNNTTNTTIINIILFTPYGSVVILINNHSIRFQNKACLYAGVVPFLLLFTQTGNYEECYTIVVRNHRKKKKTKKKKPNIVYPYSVSKMEEMANTCFVTHFFFKCKNIQRRISSFLKFKIRNKIYYILTLKIVYYGGVAFVSNIVLFVSVRTMRW